jgi:NADPH-dependent 2,4-dienoyl-CoA reductase/sulfur reductase-like enzyme
VPGVPERLAIVGGDAAGMSAASIARRRDRGLEVVAFERGPYTSYSACGIPYYVGGLFGDADRLISRSPEEHRANGIAVRTRTEVTAIDLDRRVLIVYDRAAQCEREEPFDRLVVATGAEAVPPPVPGAEAVEPTRTVDAAERFRANLERGERRAAGGRRAVVIGAGYIGLELAEALVERGLAVTVVEKAEQVFGGLDREMAAHVQDGAEARGIQFLLSTEVQEVLVDEAERPVGVRTTQGELCAEHVTMGTGARPSVALAAAAGLQLGPSGALRVDDAQRCPGHDGVFAAGDCAESRHRLLDRPVNIQLGTHANKQGRVAGVNATGGDARFPGVIGTAVSRVCKYEVGRTGLTEHEARAAGFSVAAAEVKHLTRSGYFPGAGPVWVKLVAEAGSGRLLGGQIVGVEGAAKRIDVLATCVWTEMAVDELELLDLSYAPPLSPVYDPVLVAARAAAKAVAST